MTKVERFADKQSRDARYRELKKQGLKHVSRSTSSRAPISGWVVPGRMIWIVTIGEQHGPIGEVSAGAPTAN